MSAVISECGKYRYRLERSVLALAPTDKTYAFFGVNPSTADANINDATIRKMIGFVQAWGGKGFIVGNLFAYRATDVKELGKIEHPFGEDNFEHLRKIVDDADVLVPCWGSSDKIPKEKRWFVKEFRNFLLRDGKPVKTFGFTKSGDPKHPLMLGYNTPLEDWKL